MSATEALALFDQIPDDPAHSALLGLAVVGGGVIGGFLIGLLFQGGTKLSTGQTLPRWAVNFMRALGGLTTAVFLALMLFSEPGGRGPGKGGSGTGDGLGMGQTLFTPATGSTTEQPANKDKTPVDPPKTAKPLRIEVLPRSATEPDRWYRLEDASEKKRLTLKEVKERIRALKETPPQLTTVIVILYSDSPDKSTGPVQDLSYWIEEDAKLHLRFDLPSDPAPK